MIMIFTSFRIGERIIILKERVVKFENKEREIRNKVLSLNVNRDKQMKDRTHEWGV